MHGRAPIPRTTRIMQRFSLRNGETAVQVSLGALFLSWAVLFWGEGETFDSTPSFRAFAEIACEETWAAALAAVALVLLLTPLTACRWALFAAALLACATSSAIAEMFYRSNPQGTGPVTWMSGPVSLSAWLAWKRVTW